MKPKVLFINHKDRQCGVYQYGFNIKEAFNKSTKYKTLYAECSFKPELDIAISEMKPDLVIFNYYSGIMSWVHGVAKSYGIPTLGILHEGHQTNINSTSRDIFHYWISPDPTLIENDYVFRLVRLIPKYNKIHLPPKKFTVGSFGFGFANKGFEKLVKLVQTQTDCAHIRLHMPFNDVVDKRGGHALGTADRCRKAIYKPNITLEITHDFRTKEQILDFLASNTINAFLYDPMGPRGISSVIDSALAVDVPFAITKCDMFRHLFHINPSICIEDNELMSILFNYRANPHTEIKSAWSEESFIDNLENILERATKVFQTSTH